MHISVVTIVARHGASCNWILTVLKYNHFAYDNLLSHIKTQLKGGKGISLNICFWWNNIIWKLYEIFIISQQYVKHMYLFQKTSIRNFWLDDKCLNFIVISLLPFKGPKSIQHHHNDNDVLSVISITEIL